MAKVQQIAPSHAASSGVPPEILFGKNEEMRGIRRTVERVAGVRVPILIQGESGTGKEVLANFIHSQAPWQDMPLVKVSCAAIPGSLLESEMFGFEKGAFTGAVSNRPGKFELANGGTIVLDEIADIDAGLQAKLLQVLQDGRFSRIGDLEERRVNVRIICITNREIEQEIEKETFREDLYYRINVVNIRMPALRHRLEDIPLLAEYFLKVYGERFGRKVPGLSGVVMDRFRKHTWPGNIRELENYVKRYVILDSAETILNELDERSRTPVSGGFQLPPVTDFSLKRFSKLASQQAEHYLILEALKSTRWNRKRAAELLGISYRALLYKIKENGLPQKKRANPVA